jgi:hypothetical protein
MIDPEKNRKNVSEYRLKKLSQGWKQIKVFLSPETLKMLESLRVRIYSTARLRRGRLLSQIIRDRYLQAQRDRKND